MNIIALLLLLLGFFYFSSAGMGFVSFLCLIAVILLVLTSAFGGSIDSGPVAKTKKGGSNDAIVSMGSSFGKIVNWFGRTLGALFLGGGKKTEKKEKPQVIELVHRKR